MSNIKLEAMITKIREILSGKGLSERDFDEATKELLDLYSVSESYIKCWNCKKFEQTGTNTMGNEVGRCRLNDCEVSHPKWQKCGEYEQCGNFR